jgi:hypothetical protein
MKKKIAFWFLAVVGTPLFALVGLVIAATWGGNYAEDFFFAGYRGYEATGIIGEWVGGAIGVILSILSYRRLFKRKTTLT